MGSKLLDEWTDVIWYVVVTMTTIGYGDRVAKTSITRAIVILLLIWGNFWSSIFISVLFPYVQLSLFESKALNQYLRVKHRQKIKQHSQQVVGAMVMINYYQKRPDFSKNRRYQQKVQSLQLKIFAELRQIKSIKERLKTLVNKTNLFVDEILGDLKSESCVYEFL